MIDLDFFAATDEMEEQDKETLIKNLRNLVLKNRNLFKKSSDRLYEITSQAVAALKNIKEEKLQSVMIITFLGLLEDDHSKKLSSIGEMLENMPSIQLQLLKTSSQYMSAEIDQVVLLCSRLLEHITDKHSGTDEKLSESLMNIAKTLLKDSRSRKEKELSTKTPEQQGVQETFISQFQSLLILQCKSNFVQNSFDQEIVNQLESISNFVAESSIEKNNVLLFGILYFQAKQEEETGSNKPIFKSFVSKIRLLFPWVKKKDILDFYFSTESNTEAAFIKRWIQCSAASDNKKIATMKDAVKPAATNGANRFLDLVNDILTLEEKQYRQLLDKKTREEILKNESPIRYAHVLRREVLGMIFHSLANIYFPGVGSQQLLNIMILETNNQRPVNMVDEDWQELINLKNTFKRAHFFSKVNQIEFEWILWLKDVVIPSLHTFELPIKTVREILIVIEEFNFQEILETTLMSRPNRWLDHAAVKSVLKIANQMYGRGMESSSISTSLLSVLRHCQCGRGILNILRRKMKNETKASEQTRLEFATFERIVKLLKQIPEDVNPVSRLNGYSLNLWPKLLRQIRNEHMWSMSLSIQIARLDARIGIEEVDRFLGRFTSLDSVEDKNKKMEIIFQNLFKYSWLIEEISDEYFVEMTQNEQLILDYMKNQSSRSLDLKEIEHQLCKKSSGGNGLIRHLLTGSKNTIRKQAEDIKMKRKNYENFSIRDIKLWAKEVRERTESLDIVEYLSIACQAVKNLKGFYPRDTQLVAVLLFSESSNQGSSCMAEISTGEGKTIITSLLGIYFALMNKFVHIVTSSSVLAEENVVEVRNIFEQFGVTVDNNCDQKCASDENERRNRYKSDVIYGDLSSFQRDLLMTKVQHVLT